ncbi:hypothetical protein HA402_006743 [Bradysia odoriphaga]|nr:hypothetical protein HA402_006743 [Bradysia odoriphaga]
MSAGRISLEGMTSAAALLSGQTPLAVRMRPTSLAEVAGQKHLLRAGSPIVALADPDAASPGAVSIILWGPPGTGKTTLAQAIARSSGRRFVELSAITAGVKDVREVMQEAVTQRDLYGQTTILFLDEIHRFTKAQQDALLPGVENGWVILIAATTENPSFSVISPLLSRSLLLTLQPLTDDDIGVLVDRAVVDARGLKAGVELSDEARAALIRLASGDARRALTGLEAAAAVALSTADDDADAVPQVTADDISQAVDKALLRYDRQGDEHYDVISAFIKSIRGSDPDAALHYLARMIEAGEDPRFIARRLVISASEDVGPRGSSGPGHRGRRRRRRGVHRHAGGAHPPRGGDRVPGDHGQVERGLRGHRCGDRRHPRRRLRPRAAAPAGRALSGGEAPRPRPWLRLLARQRVRDRSAAVPAGRARRAALLRAEEPRSGARRIGEARADPQDPGRPLRRSTAERHFDVKAGGL